MDFHAIYGQYQGEDVRQSGPVHNQRVACGRFTANSGLPYVPTPAVNNFQKRVAAAADDGSMWFGDALMVNSSTNAFRIAFEEQTQRFRATLMSNHSYPLGLGTRVEMRECTGSAPPHHARTLSKKTATIQYGVDDLFETVPVHDHFPEETEKASSLLPPLGGYQAAQVPDRATTHLKPPPGLDLPSDHAGAACMAGPPVHSELAEAMYAYGTPPMVAHESLLKEWKQTTHDSLATVSTGIGSSEQAELEEEDAPKKKKKSGKQRFCKAKRDRYRHLVEVLVEQAKADPASFSLPEDKLPPGIAASKELKAKLFATVMKFACVAGAVFVGTEAVH